MTEIKQNTVQLKVFASYRVALGKGEFQLELPQAINTVADFLAWLTDTKPDFAVVTAASDKLIAVNQVLTDASAPLRPGDELALLPPVTGG